jgi:hypothetical protein
MNRLLAFAAPAVDAADPAADPILVVERKSQGTMQ